MKSFGVSNRAPLLGRLSIAFIVLAGLAASVVVNHLVFAQDAETTPELPDVNVQVILLRDGLEKGQITQLNVIVTNKSKTALQDVSFSIVPEDFIDNIKQDLGPDIAPFGSVQTSVVVGPSEQVGFGKHTLIVTVFYSWGDEAKFMSSQVVTVDITVKRKFEDELGGLLGGGAALLYFLLPIYPAIAAYKTLEMLRKGEGIKIPSINLANVFPGAVASIAANLIIGPFIGKGDLLDLWNFFGVVGGSLAVGAIIPAGHLLWDKWQEYHWGHTETESEIEMLRKTLTRFRLPEPGSSWVTVKIGTDSWEGFFLEKRKKACVLGITFMASIVNGDPEATKKQVWDDKGMVRDAKLLIELVKRGEISINRSKNMKHNEKEIDAKVKIIPGTYELVKKEESSFVKPI